MESLIPSIHLGGRLHFNPADLLLLKAQENYTEICLISGQSHLVATTLGKLERRLKPFGFFRANRSTVVNIDCITGLAQKANTVVVRMSNKETIDVSRRRKQLFLEAVS